MTIKTYYSVGDYILVNGCRKKIIVIHLYESAEKHTERYYLGDAEWLTFRFDKKRKNKNGS
jgi:hypothetical protein